jgi:hypothetical protein
LEPTSAASSRSVATVSEPIISSGTGRHSFFCITARTCTGSRSSEGLSHVGLEDDGKAGQDMAGM